MAKPKTPRRLDGSVVHVRYGERALAQLAAHGMAGKRTRLTGQKVPDAVPVAYQQPAPLIVAPRLDLTGAAKGISQAANRMNKAIAAARTAREAALGQPDADR